MSATVHIKYEGVEKTIAGDVDEVWTGVNRFFGEVVPLFDAVKDVVLTVDLVKVIDGCKNLVAVTAESPFVLVSKQKLTDSESLLLLLLAAYVGGRLGILERKWLSREELSESLGKSRKITATRLGELYREKLLLQTGKEEGYELSTFGIKRMVEEILPHIRKKT